MGCVRHSELFSGLQGENARCKQTNESFGIVPISAFRASLPEARCVPAPQGSHDARQNPAPSQAWKSDEKRWCGHVAWKHEPCSDGIHEQAFPRRETPGWAGQVPAYPATAHAAPFRESVSLTNRRTTAPCVRPAHLRKPGASLWLPPARGHGEKPSWTPCKPLRDAFHPWVTLRLTEPASALPDLSLLSSRRRRARDPAHFSSPCPFFAGLSFPQKRRSGA